MAPVFGHGQLRLYLLAILQEGPRSGYDIIRGLEDRFEGLYSPSAGTVYPRLAKLEEEGLIERTDEGRRSIYALLDAGRAELDRRRGELEELEESLDESAGQLADEMRERVRTGTDDVRARLEEAARRARERAERSSGGGDPQEASQAWQGSGPWTGHGLGSGLPFSPGSGIAEWVKLARWVAESGMASVRTGGWGPRPADGSRAEGAASQADAGPFATAGSSTSAGSRVPAGSSPDGDSSAGPSHATEPADDSRQAPYPAPTTWSDAGPAKPRDVWATLTDTVGDTRTAGPARASTSSAGAAAPGQGAGSRQGPQGPFGGWEDLLEGAIPDAEQMREISEIVRDATARIQEVLRRRQP